MVFLIHDTIFTNVYFVNIYYNGKDRKKETSCI